MVRVDWRGSFFHSLRHLFFLQIMKLGKDNLNVSFYESFISIPNLSIYIYIYILYLYIDKIFTKIFFPPLFLPLRVLFQSGLSSSPI
jgi:hypothetical protein